MSRMKESLSFFRRFLANPGRIGSITPSSRHLALALTRPLADAGRPVDILELGAGTGAVTRFILPLLGAEDRLDIIEADPDLAEAIRRTCLQNTRWEDAARSGRIRMFDRRVQNVKELRHYDFIISGLPLNAFALREARAILETVKQHARPHCVFSYFEYIGIRPLMAAVRPGVKGRQFRLLSAYLDREIHQHEIDRESVLLNVPPAFARHLRFEPAA